MKDFKEVEHYICGELNCLELKLEQNEDEYVVYKCEPDNKLMGSVLKKAFDKKFKEKITKLTSDELAWYIKEGYLMVDATKIEDGWLKVEKNFNAKYMDNKEKGCASNFTSCVMLNITIDEPLKV